MRSQYLAGPYELSKKLMEEYVICGEELRIGRLSLSVETLRDLMRLQDPAWKGSKHRLTDVSSQQGPQYYQNRKSGVNLRSTTTTCSLPIRRDPLCWNIVIGGAAGCFSALADRSAVTGAVSLKGLLIAASDVPGWTPGHSWGLAIAKSKDCATAEVPMLPVVDSPFQLLQDPHLADHRDSSAPR